jgi:hypothetical protein
VASIRDGKGKVTLVHDGLGKNCVAGRQIEVYNDWRTMLNSRRLNIELPGEKMDDLSELQGNDVSSKR